MKREAVNGYRRACRAEEARGGRRVLNENRNGFNFYGCGG